MNPRPLGRAVRNVFLIVSLAFGVMYIPNPSFAHTLDGTPSPTQIQGKGFLALKPMPFASQPSSGQATVTIDGFPYTASVVVHYHGFSISGDGWSINLGSAGFHRDGLPTSDGFALDLDSDLFIDARGLRGTTRASVFALPSEKRMGFLSANPTGRAMGTIHLFSSVSTGESAIQFNGMIADGSALSVTVGMDFLTAPEIQATPIPSAASKPGTNASRAPTTSDHPLTTASPVQGSSFLTTLIWLIVLALLAAAAVLIALRIRNRRIATQELPPQVEPTWELPANVTVTHEMPLHVSADRSQGLTEAPIGDDARGTRATWFNDYVEAVWDAWAASRKTRLDLG